MALLLEHAERRAHSGAGHPQLFGELRLTGEPLARRKMPVRQRGPEMLIGQLYRRSPVCAHREQGISHCFSRRNGHLPDLDTDSTQGQHQISSI